MPTPLRLLIVEDSPDDAELLLRALRHAGYELEWRRVETEPDFLAGLEWGPELIISDYSMPNFSGLRAVDLARNSGLDIPFLLVSGTVGEEAAVEAMRHGATDYLLKDRIARLASAVGRALEQKRMQETQRILTAEVDLRERRLESFFMSSTVGLVLLDNNLRYVKVSNVLAEINGVPAGQHAGKTPCDIIPDIAPMTMPLLQQVRDTGVPVRNMEISARRGEEPGEMRHWMVSYFPVPGYRGEADGIGGVIVDITDRKRAEEESRESEERFRQVTESIDDVFWLSDLQSRRMMYVSPAYEKIWQRQRHELYGAESWVGSVHPDDRDYAAAALQKMHLSWGNGITYRIVRPDGSVRWIHDRAFPIQDARGRVFRVAGVAKDITEQRRAMESQARLAMAVEQSAESIVITDAQGSIQYVNPAFERVTGYTREEALRQNPRILKSNKHGEEFYRTMWETLLRGDTWSGQMVNRRKDGTLYEEEVTISPMRDATGAIVNYVAVKRDVTRECQLEEQLRQAQKMEAIGQMAGGIAHDFNNLLLVIQLQSSMLLMEPGIDGETKGKIQEIMAAAERAATLTRQLLTFSHQGHKQARNIRLSDCFEALVKLIRRILGEDIVIKTDFASPLPMVHADVGMMEQILMNLSVNARDAMPQGGQLCIGLNSAECSVEEAAEGVGRKPGRFVCLSVADTGCGISPENLPRIFEPFFTTKEVGKGTGLGLATVFGIVRQHQGWVEVDSVVGQGATFRVYLPAVEGNPAATAVLFPKRAAGGSETILLVEDEPMVRRMARLILERHGYRVHAAESGAQAQELWRLHREEIRLLLTDIIMPGGLSGYDLVREFSRDKPDLRVVYSSGYSKESITQQPKLRTHFHFLQKPYTATSLASAVRRCLDQAGAVA